MKQTWYRINIIVKSIDFVEYSTDFDWFCQNQTRLVKSGNKYNFCSRIEARSFRIERAIFFYHEFSDEKLISTWKEIHQEILDGKHGEGKIVH